MNKFFIISISVLLLYWCTTRVFLLYLDTTFPEEEIQGWFEPITSKYGIKIVYEIGDDFFSDLVNPIIPAGPDRSSNVEPIRHRVLATYPDILDKAFKKYPVNVIRSYLKGIHFAAEIDQGGFKYGGSYDPFRKIIFLVNDGFISEDHAIKTVHHELSSLFLLSHSFFINPWTDQNPKDFEYLYDVTDNKLKTYNSSSSVGTELDYEKGFMDTYGQTDFENDFNEYSTMIFTHPQKFKKIMNQYPRVRGKFLVWLEFYQKIDPIFTEEYVLGGSMKRHGNKCIFILMADN